MRDEDDREHDEALERVAGAQPHEAARECAAGERDEGTPAPEPRAPDLRAPEGEPES